MCKYINSLNLIKKNIRSSRHKYIPNGPMKYEKCKYEDEITVERHLY
jgi:hypothetical protein